MFRKLKVVICVTGGLPQGHCGCADAGARIPAPAEQGAAADPRLHLRALLWARGTLLVPLNLCAASDKLPHSSRLFHCFEDERNVQSSGWLFKFYFRV